MKGLFLIFEALSEHSGISKKILTQIDAFRNNGIEMELSSLLYDKNIKYNYTGRIINNQKIDIYSKNKLLNRLQRLTRYEKTIKYIKENEIKLVYIRYTHIANSFFINFLKELKSINVTILLEVPTYPYDQEYIDASLKLKTMLMIEKYYRRKLKYYIKNIITFSNASSIFDVPTIKISNGVDIKEIKLKQDKCTENIHLIGLAALSFWHGFDRIIEGLKNYYSSKNSTKVYFHIVGDKQKPEAHKYKNLTERYKLTQYVIFHDKQFGDNLDKIFDKCQMGIGCLAVHRKGITYIKSIKNREYCARGIPFIYSEIDEDFENMPFILKAPADESPIDISKIVEFLETNNFNKHEIRDYAEKYLTWDYQVKKIIEQANLKQLI